MIIDFITYDRHYHHLLNRVFNFSSPFMAESYSDRVKRIYL